MINTNGAEYDIIIAGAGIAGLTSAIYTCRAGKKVLVLESQICGGQIINALNIENWPGAFGVSGADLIKNTQKQATDLGAKIEFAEITKISENNKIFTVQTDEGSFTALSIILAVGAKPRKLGKKQTEEASDRPISYCATCDGALYKNQPVVVIGSGNTAKSEIEYLQNIASKVYQIHHDDPIPKDAAAIFVAIGHIPNTDFLKGFVELDSAGYIKAGENCNTSRPGVFVAGDCRVKEIRQLVTAAGDGAIAAEAAVNYLNQ